MSAPDIKRSVPPELAGLLERPVATYAVYCRIAGSVDGGVLLGQMTYYTSIARKRDGWWSHEMACFLAATGVREDAQRATRKKLKELGVLNEVRTISGRVAARIDLDRLAALVRLDHIERQANRQEEHNGPCFCSDPGLAVRAAEVAAREATKQKDPEPGITGSRSGLTRVPNLAQQKFQNSDHPGSLYPENTPETTPEISPSSPPQGAGKTAPPKNGGGKYDLTPDQIQQSPILQGVVSEVVIALRGPKPPQNIRSFTKTVLQERDPNASLRFLNCLVTAIEQRHKSFLERNSR